MTHPRPEIKETTVSEDSDHYRDCGTADDHYWVASAPTRTGHDDIDPVAEPDHSTAALADRWDEAPASVLRDIAAGTDPVDPDECAANPTFRAVVNAAYAAGAKLTGIRPIVEAQIGAHLAERANVVTVYGMADAGGKVYAALSEEHALDLATSPNPMYGPHPRETVWWTVTTSAPVPYEPAAAAAVSEVAA